MLEVIRSARINSFLSASGVVMLAFPKAGVYSAAPETNLDG